MVVKWPFVSLFFWGHPLYDSATKKPIILYDKLVSYLLQIDYFQHHFVLWNKAICSWYSRYFDIKKIFPLELNVGVARLLRTIAEKLLLKKFYKNSDRNSYWRIPMLCWRKFRLEKLKNTKKYYLPFQSEFGQRSRILIGIFLSEKQMASAIVRYSFIHFSTQFSLMFLNMSVRLWNFKDGGS